MPNTALTVENPAVIRIATQLGLLITTDQEGKDNADTSAGIILESRYFVGGVLVERVVAPAATGRQFIWTVRSEHEFTIARDAFAFAAKLAS